MKLATIFLAGFALWVTNGDRIYRRAVFNNYAECATAGQSQVDSLRDVSPAITWTCVPESVSDER
jgi:hypothetical protein